VSFKIIINYLMEYLNYIFVIVALTLLIVLLSIALLKEDNNDDNFLFYIFLSISIGIPMLYWVLKLTFNILMLWYFILAIVLIVLAGMALNKPNVKKINKFFIIILTVISLYLLYDYRKILEIDFSIKINHQLIFAGD
jgi:hypothetical protein